MSRTSVTVLGRSQPGRAGPGRSGPWPFSAFPGRSSLRLGGQVGLDDLHRDRRGRVGPQPAPLDYDADRDLGVADRRETGEYRVVEPGVVRAVLCRPGLGRAGDVLVAGRVVRW